MDVPLFTKSDQDMIAKAMADLDKLRDRLGPHIAEIDLAALHNATHFVARVLLRAKADEYVWRDLDGDARIHAFLKWEGRGGRYDAKRRIVTWPPASVHTGSILLDVDLPDYALPWAR